MESYRHNYLFRCDKCHFVTDNKKDYRRHTESAKHARRTGAINVNVKLPTSEQMSQQDNSAVFPSTPPTFPTGHQTSQLAFIFDKHIYKYCDKCGNKYHSKSGLWKHRKTCDGIPSQIHTNSMNPTNQVIHPPAPVANDSGLTSVFDLKTIMIEMLKTNQEFQNKVFEMMCSHQSLAINAATTAATAASSAASTAATAATEPRRCDCLLKSWSSSTASSRASPTFKSSLRP